MKQIKKATILLIVNLFIFNFGFSQVSSNYTVKHLNDCNNELSNFGTTFYGNDKMIYASPDRKHKIIKDIWNPNQQPFLDLFVGTITEDGEIVDGKQLVGDVKTKYHEADVVFTKDLKTVYFTRDNYYKEKRRIADDGITHLALFRADVTESGEWQNIVEFPYNNRNFSIGHPALSADEKTLYFISDMPSSLGLTDIFKVTITGDNTYSLPENLGPKVNTAAREMFAFVSSKDILYFASDGWKGLGGLDVFAFDLKSSVEKPTNLGEPINSYEDDFAFLINEDKQDGYFSSRRGGGKGDDDIYYFKQNKPIKFDCKQEVKGIVKDKESGRRIPNALVVLYDSKGAILEEVIVDESARFSFNIDCMSSYKVEASKENYSMDSKEFESNPELELALDLGLSKGVAATTSVSVTQPYQPQDTYVDSTPKPVRAFSDFETTKRNCQEALNNINTIYFDLNKSYIRPDAAYELDKVVDIMKRCVSVTVEAGSHTDCRASNKYNDALSQRRAVSTMNYIKKKGINTIRLSAKGYGERQLLNHCADGVKCTEDEHQINRRTEFRITNW